MTFEVFLARPVSKNNKKTDRLEQKIDDKPSWEKDGIKVSRYMYLPTCPFCGLKDLGKHALERPTKTHMRYCKSRKLTPKPVDIINGVRTERRGSFKWQCFPISIRYPIRNIRVIKEVVENPDGSTSIKNRYLCSYKWETWLTYDWVWNGEKMVPWYVVELDAEGERRVSNWRKYIRKTKVL